MKCPYPRRCIQFFPSPLVLSRGRCWVLPCGSDLCALCLSCSVFFVPLHPGGGLLPSVLLTEAARLRRIFVFIVFAAVVAALASCRDDGGDQAVCRCKAHACTWTSDIYEEKKLYDKSLHYNKLSYEYAKKSDVPSIEVYSLRDIGRSYSYLKRNNIAIPYYIKAAEKAKAIGDANLYNMVFGELAAIYIEENRLAEAYKVLSLPFICKTQQDLSAHYFTLSVYHDSVSNLDSAIYYNKLDVSSV